MRTKNGDRLQGLSSPEKWTSVLNSSSWCRETSRAPYTRTISHPPRGMTAQIQWLVPWCPTISLRHDVMYPLSKVHEKLKQWPLFTLTYILKALWFIEKTHTDYCIWPSQWLWGIIIPILWMENLRPGTIHSHTGAQCQASVSRYFLSLSLNHLQATSESYEVH